MTLLAVSISSAFCEELHAVFIKVGGTRVSLTLQGLDMSSSFHIIYISPVLSIQDFKKQVGCPWCKRDVTQKGTIFMIFFSLLHRFLLLWLISLLALLDTCWAGILPSVKLIHLTDSRRQITNACYLKELH